MAYMGRYADLRLRIGSLREPGEPPAIVTISLNGKPVPSFEVDSLGMGRLSSDTREAPNPYLDPAHIQLDIESSTIERADGTTVE